MSDALAPSRVMRARANLKCNSVARAIAVNSQSLGDKSTWLNYTRRAAKHGTLCPNFQRIFVSRDRLRPSQH
jgi:hypothetical protein